MRERTRTGTRSGTGTGTLTRWTLVAMVVTDLGFLFYWAMIVTGRLPARVMFAEYADPRVTAWNWSFLPLDVAASVLGLSAVRSLRQGDRRAPARLAASLALTCTAGGMALAFWAQRGQFDPAWLLPNAFLLVFPLPLLIRLFSFPEPVG